MKQMFEETREKIIKENVTRKFNRILINFQPDMANTLTFEEFVASISTKDKILKRIFECFVKVRSI